MEQNKEKEESLETLLEELLQLRRTLKMESYLSFQYTRDYYYDTRGKTLIKNESLSGQAVPNDLELIKQVVETGKKQYPAFNVKVELRAGDMMPKQMGSVQALYDIDGVSKGQDQNISHRGEEVLYIQIWATWCGPCQSAMTMVNALTQKNKEKWGDGKVRLMAVSVDDESQKVVDRIEKRQWYGFNHFWMKGWDGNHPLIKYLRVRGIPQCCIVNRQGKLDYTGHPSKADLDDRITRLINEKVPDKNSKENVEEVKTETEITQQSFQQQVAFFEQELEALLKEKVPDFNGVLKIQMKKQVPVQAINSSGNELRHLMSNLMLLGDKDQLDQINTLAAVVKNRLPKTECKSQFVSKDLKHQTAKNLKFLRKQFKLLEIENVKIIVNHQKSVVLKKNDGQDEDEEEEEKQVFQGLQEELEQPDEQQKQNKLKFALKFNKNNIYKVQGILLKDLPEKKLTTLTEKLKSRIEQQKALGLQTNALENFWVQLQNKSLEGSRFPALEGFYDRQDVKKNEFVWSDVLLQDETQGNKNSGDKQTKKPLLVWVMHHQIEKTIDGLTTLLKLALSNAALQKSSFTIIILCLSHPDQIEVHPGMKSLWRYIRQEKFDYRFLYIKEAQLAKKIIDKLEAKTFPHLTIINSKGICHSVIAGDKNLFAYEYTLQLNYLAISDNAKDQQLQTSNYLESYRATKKFIIEVKAKSKDFLSGCFQHLLYKPNFKVRVQRLNCYDENGKLEKKLYSIKPFVSYELRETDSKQLLAYLQEKLYSMAKPNLFLTREKLTPTHNVPLGSICALCDSKIDPKQAHFWCFHRKEHLCRACGEFEDKSQDIFAERFKYLHNLVLINIGERLEHLKDIDEFKFGADTQPKPDQEVSQNPRYSCNSCGGNPPAGLSMVGIRYVCLNCRPGMVQAGGFHDYCPACLTVVSDVNHPEQKKHLQRYETQGHQKEHLLLRILTDEGGYYNY